MATTFSAVVLLKLTGATSVTFNFNDSAILGRVARLFETVSLVGLTVDVSCPVAPSGSVTAVIHDPDVPVVTLDDAYLFRVCEHHFLGPHMPTLFQLSMPPEFGRQIKGTNLGNECPAVTVITTTPKAAALSLTAVVRLTATLTGSGTGLSMVGLGSGVVEASESAESSGSKSAAKSSK